MALDGVKNVQAIADALGMHQPHVSRDLLWLKKRGLIDVVEADGQGTIYKKTIFDSIINLSEELAKKFSLNKHGLPSKKK